MRGLRFKEELGFLKRLGTPFRLGVFITLVASVLMVLGPNWHRGLELRARDMLLENFGGGEPTGRVVQVRVDETSLKRLGPWPWSASIHARLIKALDAADAGAVAFTFPFHKVKTASQESLAFIKKKYLDLGLISRGPEGLEFYRVLSDTLPDTDAAGELTEALSGFGRVVLPAAPDGGDSGNHSEIGLAMEKAWAGFSPLKADDLKAPPKTLITWAAGIGHIRSFPDADGVIRSVPLFVEWGARLLPSLGMEAVRVHMGLAKEDVRPVAGEGVRLGKNLVPTDRTCRLYLNRGTGESQGPSFSYADILRGRVPSSGLAQKLVLVVGPGGGKAINTPWGTMERAELFATQVDNILAGNPLKPSSKIRLLGLLLILVAGLAVSLVLDRLSLTASLATALFVSGISFLLAWLITARWGYVFDFFTPTILAPAIFLVAAVPRLPELLEPKGSRRGGRAAGLSSRNLGTLEVAWSRHSTDAAGLAIETAVTRKGASCLFVLSTDGPSELAPGMAAMARTLLGRGLSLEDVAGLLGESYNSGGEVKPSLRFLGLNFERGSREIKILNSGHPAPILIKSGERGFRNLGRRGEPLGSQLHGPTWALNAIFERGDLLVAAVGLKDALLLERLGELAAKLRDEPIANIVRRLDLTLRSSKPEGGLRPGVVVIKNA